MKIKNILKTTIITGALTIGMLGSIALATNHNNKIAYHFLNNKVANSDVDWHYVGYCEDESIWHSDCIHFNIYNDPKNFNSIKIELSYDNGHSHDGGWNDNWWYCGDYTNNNFEIKSNNGKAYLEHTCHNSFWADLMIRSAYSSVPHGFWYDVSSGKLK